MGDGIEPELLTYDLFTAVILITELILYYSFMKRKNVSPINVRSKTLTSIFTFFSSIFILILSFFAFDRLHYSCQVNILIAFFHQTFTIWVYIVQAWRVHFIYLMNKEKLKSIKRFIKSVKSDTNTSTSNEKITSKFKQEYESSIINSTAESNFWEGIEEDNDEEIDKKFEKVEKKFYQKRIRISGKYMFYAILIHFIFMLLIIGVLHADGKSERKADGKCEYGDLYYVLISIVSMGHILLFAYYLYKIWKIKDNFKIRNQLYMIFITCILTTIVFSSKQRIDEMLLWQWPFTCIIVAQYLIILGYPLWLSRKPYKLTKGRDKNKLENGEDTVEKFTHILTDKNKSKYFLKYLQLDYSIENLLFYQAVTSFEKINPNKKRKKKKYCEQIIKNFVRVNARLEVNLSHSTRTSTIELAEKDPTNPSCFEEAKNKIFFLMYSGSYPNFLFSKQYYEMMIDIDQINIEIGGEKDIQLEDLKEDEDDDHESESQNQSKKDINKESENESKNEKVINNEDENSDDDDRIQNQSKFSSENKDESETSSETSNLESDSDSDSDTDSDSNSDTN
ncbi:regulator of g protein signaling [Anaeramoeba flamelloides]|uniref:Regulator of g protein signaling n=1 Tax=Anaeramoeba flamelloides TaxID=1746091 RepID=A0AAV7Z6W0_9EUKA|nr:regulator of g protein signaling [Anaeramoeba flamelloides]